MDKISWKKVGIKYHDKEEMIIVIGEYSRYIELKCHGTVDGIYRLSGVTSNIQKLR